MRQTSARQFCTFRQPHGASTRQANYRRPSRRQIESGLVLAANAKTANSDGQGNATACAMSPEAEGIGVGHLPVCEVGLPCSGPKEIQGINNEPLQFPPRTYPSKIYVKS